jgi:nitrate reductase molybdenum cofactor assembly chaperone NarJ/NarW
MAASPLCWPRRRPRRLEELFTATFDLQPVCHPYVGYQLCGESQQRTLFLMQVCSNFTSSTASRRTVSCPIIWRRCCGLSAALPIATAGRRSSRTGCSRPWTKWPQGLEGEKHPYGELLKAVQNFPVRDGRCRDRASDGRKQKELSP